MTLSSYHRDNCRLCGSKNVKLVMPLVPTPIEDDYVTSEQLGEIQTTYPIDLFMCSDCGHVQILDVVNPEILFRNYIYVTSSSLGLLDHFRKYANDVITRFRPPSNSLIVEIGSNDGTMLKFFKEHGLKVLGIDPAVEIAARVTNSGIETLPEFFNLNLARKIKKEHGPATIITANNVFAHSDDMTGIADGIQELLAPNGVFIFEVSYLVDILEKVLFDTVFHEHLCYHSVNSLQKFLSNHGLEFIDIHRIPSKGGSLRGFVQQKGGTQPISPSIKSLLYLETQMHLDEPSVFELFQTKLNDTRKELHQLLNQFKAQGKTVAGYGASPTVTTFIYQLELRNFLNFLVDDNPIKHHRYSPGYHIQVLPSQTLGERLPDYTVILAWIYADPIIKKNQHYLNSGGKFIIPFPEIKIVSLNGR